MATKPKLEKKKTVEALKHEEASRKNIPTAEFQSVMQKEQLSPVRVAYERGVSALDQEKQHRNHDLDPQLVWRGKDEQDWSDLVIYAPPLYIQEKVHPKVLIDDLLRRSAADQKSAEDQFDLFSDFNGVPEGNAKTEFYQHDANWSNRMILGDSLQVMASLAEREGLRGQVQCIYIDPPYGIKFNSNFQWSTTSRDVKDGSVDHITREPEQVKAFRDTWRHEIHSYLTYLRDRLTAARDLLADSGSIFVQIGDENVHVVRNVMDEVLGKSNFVSMITVAKTSSQTAQTLANVSDHVLWYAKRLEKIKYRGLNTVKAFGGDGASGYGKVELPDGCRRPLSVQERQSPSIAMNAGRIYSVDNLTSQRPPGDFPVDFNGRAIRPKRGYWKSGEIGMARLVKAWRVELVGNTLRYVRFIEDYPVFPLTNIWGDTTVAGFASDKRYIVETSPKIIERCVLMVTDPGDLVLDPTCGSGTTAYVSEQWGRRWITVDTSRVALALARARVMGARYPYYLLADSKDGQQKEAEVTHSIPSAAPSPSESIEHIWANSKAPDKHRDRLGNLVLLPPKLNSTLQDDAPKNKAEAYRQTGLLIAGEVANTIEKDGWKAHSIEEREDALLKWAATEWVD
jgi:adenine-specific DNA-methyltransferase